MGKWKQITESTKKIDSDILNQSLWPSRRGESSTLQGRMRMVIAIGMLLLFIGILCMGHFIIFCNDSSDINGWYALPLLCGVALSFAGGLLEHSEIPSLRGDVIVILCILSVIATALGRKFSSKSYPTLAGLRMIEYPASFYVLASFCGFAATYQYVVLT